MSQEQIVITGIIVLNLVLLILLFTAYRLLATKSPAEPTHTTHLREAEEIRSLEALFAHDSWPDGHDVRGDRFSTGAVDGFRK